ncbi:MAG: (Fe-S)-binding protein [Chloroflexota bacterium]
MTAEIPDYTEIYEGDRYCLMCRHVCPVERVTKREATSPHGWALLVASERRGLVQWDAETVDTLYQCADCGLCQANCVSVRPLPAAIVAARATVAQRGFAPDRVRLVDENLRKWGQPYGEAFHNPFTDLASGGAEIGLFVGAATTASRAETVDAAIKLLDAAGVSHSLISTGRSGVYLPYTLGLWDTARTIALQTIEEIEGNGIKQVITLSREDTHAFMHIYEEIGVKLPEDVHVVEFIEWLWAAIGAGKLRTGKLALAGYVYHDPVHTPRVLRAAACAHDLLAELVDGPMRRMLWRGNTAAPSGAVGGFEFTQPALVEMLNMERIAEAKRAGAAGIVTEDPQCTAQLAKYAEGLPVVNLVELLAEQI